MEVAREKEAERASRLIKAGERNKKRAVRVVAEPGNIVCGVSSRSARASCFVDDAVSQSGTFQIYPTSSTSSPRTKFISQDGVNPQKSHGRNFSYNSDLRCKYSRPVARRFRSTPCRPVPRPITPASPDPARIRILPKHSALSEFSQRCIPIIYT